MLSESATSIEQLEKISARSLSREETENRIKITTIVFVSYVLEDSVNKDHQVLENKIKKKIKTM
jgi:hypothetical protein